LWAQLTAVGMVISERVVNGITSIKARYDIGSIAGTAEEYLPWVRGHWGIENALHWVRDVCFREDDPRHWGGPSAPNLAWVRKLALCVLKSEKTSKARSLNHRRHLAGRQNDYLWKVLAQIHEESGA
jgi:predicted transposase YbfD/YdcC